MDGRYKASAQEYLHSTRKWLSELDSWSIELMFLQRMLDIYGLKAEDETQSAKLCALRSHIGSFLSDGIAQRRDLLHGHERHLQQIVADKLLLKDKELPYRQSDAEKAILEGRSSFYGIQERAFAVIEDLKRS